MNAGRGGGSEQLARERRAGKLLVAAVAALAVVAAACGGSNASGGGGGGPIVIGASLPLTGDFSQPGTAAKQGYQIWQSMVNSSGGLLGRKVQLKIVDDASDQNQIVTDYNRLITQDKVDLLLGTFSSLLNLPASAVAERNKMVYVEPAGGAPEMFSRGFHYLFFAQQATAPHQADQFVKWIKSLPAAQRPKTAAYPTQDDPFTKPVIDSIRKHLEALGVRTVYQTVYPPDTSNFSTIASAIKAKSPDLIAHGAVFEDGIGMIRALENVGFSPKIFFETSAPSQGDQFSKGIGIDNTEGIFYTVSWSPDADYPQNKQFVQQYEQRFGGVPPEDAADAFAAAQVLQKAVEAVGEIDQAKIADWLHSHSVDTILGRLSWDETGAPQQSFLLAQWQNGRSEIVLPKEVATTDHVVFPKPPWK